MYLITYRDGTTEPAGTYAAACNRIKAGWREAVIGHDGDMEDGGNRTLCWADADDAANYVEAKAIASIWWIDD
jgi:hypothetical protein